MAIIFTRETNRVDVDIDSGARKMSLDPNLNVSGLAGGKDVYFHAGPLDQFRKEYTLTFPVVRISGRPNNNAQDVAEWLADTYFTGNNYGTGGGGGDATAANQVTMIGELQDIELDVEAVNTSVQGLITKTKGSDVTISYDSKEIVYHVGGGLDGKMNYISYKTGGRFGTEVARKTLYYDGNNKLQYTEVT